MLDIMDITGIPHPNLKSINFEKNMYILKCVWKYKHFIDIFNMYDNVSGLRQILKIYINHVID